MEEQTQITEPREQMLIGIIESLSKDLELIKLKEIAEVKAGIKVLNAKLDKILVGQEEAKKHIATLQPDYIDYIRTVKMQSDSIGELTRALASAKSTEIEKFASGSGNRGKYKELEDYVVAYEVALAKNNLDISFSPWITADGEELIIGMIKHESGEWIKCIIKVVFDDNVGNTSGANQGWSSGRTYAKKNIYAALMGV